MRLTDFIDAPKFLVDATTLSKREVLEKAYTIIILNLINNVIRQDNKEINI